MTPSPSAGLTVERVRAIREEYEYQLEAAMYQAPHWQKSPREIIALCDSWLDSANNFNQEFFALRDALRDWPKLPPAYVLKWLHFSFPDDWERGVEMQRELGLSVIPPKTECEGGAGMWDRITNGAWRPLPAPPSAPSPGEGEK